METTLVTDKAEWTWKLKPTTSTNQGLFLILPVLWLVELPRSSFDAFVFLKLYLF